MTWPLWARLGHFVAFVNVYFIWAHLGQVEEKSLEWAIIDLLDI
jgi:hypothetical protein